MVLPAVSTILRAVTNTTVNDVLASTLGQLDTVIPPDLDALCSVGKTNSSKEGAEESTEDSDADVDDGSESSESHRGGTITPAEKKFSMVLCILLVTRFFICLVRDGLHHGMCCFGGEIWCNAEVIR